MRTQVLFSFLIVVTLFLCGCETKTSIANYISERDANEIVVLLQSRGIQAEKLPAPAATVGGTAGQTLWNISVPSNQITESLSILNQAGLPRTKGTSLLDLFGTQGLVPSDLQDRIRYQEGLSEQLATTIRKMEGIIDANVQITFPNPDDETHKTMTASVYIKHRGMLDNQNSLIVNKIKRLVSSAVPGLSPENVSVVADRALYADLSPSATEGVREEEKHYVSIWSVIVAKESAWRFRIIFYTFIILLFICASLLAWTLWKIAPLLRHQGGLKKLFDPTQIDPLKFKSETVEEFSETTEE